MSARPRYEDANGMAAVERLIAQVLLWGGLVSGVLVLFGLVLSVTHGGLQGHVLDLERSTRAGTPDHPPGVFISLREVLGALTVRPVDPRAVVALGLALLLVTPVLGVIVAVPGFLSVGDRRYAGIAVIVLCMLLVSLVVAGGAG